MPRLHVLYLPHGERFAFILDQTNPMNDLAEGAWRVFAEKCGADDILITADTIDVDPEMGEPFEPVDLFTDDHDGCNHAPRFVTDLIDQVRNAHAAAWVPWTPANLDPESPEVMTHRVEVCPAIGNGVSGCPMHAPIDNGPWVSWPYYVSHNPEIGATITRICEHGITHPTPEEYLGGMDIPHLCDGCECASEEDRDRYAIVVSDLANTRLPRGTLLLGVKDDPMPVTAPPATSYHSAPAEGLTPVRVPDLKPCDGHATWDGVSPDTELCALGMGHRGFHMAVKDGHLGGYFHAGDPIPAPEGEGPIAFVAADRATDWVEKQAGDVRCGARYFTGVGSLGCNLSHDHLGNHTAGLVSWLNDGPDAADRAPSEWYQEPVTEPLATPTMADLAAENWGTARIQPLGPDGEPVGEAGVYDLPGPVRVTEIPAKPGDPVLVEQAFEPFGSSPVGPDEVRLCMAASNGARCTREYRHDGLHEFGPFTRV